MKNNEKMKLTVKDGKLLQSAKNNESKCCDPCECGIPGCDCEGCC